MATNRKKVAPDQEVRTLEGRGEKDVGQEGANKEDCGEKTPAKRASKRAVA